MGLYRISAGDNRTFRHKQNFESSEFDLNGLNCIYIYIYIYISDEHYIPEVEMKTI